MTTHSLRISRSDLNAIAPVLATSLIVLFLFFIDEGYYDFRWMTDPGNWFVFFIYFAILLPLQLLISEWMLKRVKPQKKILAMVFVSAPLTTILLLLLLTQI